MRYTILLSDVDLKLLNEGKVVKGEGLQIVPPTTV